MSILDTGNFRCWKARMHKGLVLCSSGPHELVYFECLEMWYILVVNWNNFGFMSCCFTPTSTAGNSLKHHTKCDYWDSDYRAQAAGAIACDPFKMYVPVGLICQTVKAQHSMDYHSLGPRRPRYKQPSTAHNLNTTEWFCTWSPPVRVEAQ